MPSGSVGAAQLSSMATTPIVPELAIVAALARAVSIAATKVCAFNCRAWIVGLEAASNGNAALTWVCSEFSAVVMLAGITVLLLPAQGQK